VTKNKLAEAATMCFACGPDNPIGLRIRFQMDGGVCTGEFTPEETHVGYRNTVHGGIIYSALDDVMANVLSLSKGAGSRPDDKADGLDRKRATQARRTQG
jgi:acyl-coenzyme A thioesterase PaaI-like protein